MVEPSNTYLFAAKTVNKRDQKLRRRRATYPRPIIGSKEAQVGKSTSDVLCADRKMPALPSDTVLAAVLVEIGRWTTPARLIFRDCASKELDLITATKFQGLTRLAGLAL